jgi:hypothetical protein
MWDKVSEYADVNRSYMLYNNSRALSIYPCAPITYQEKSKWGWFDHDNKDLTPIPVNTIVRINAEGFLGFKKGSNIQLTGFINQVAIGDVKYDKKKGKRGGHEEVEKYESRGHVPTELASEELDDGSYGGIGIDGAEVEEEARDEE